jgi:oxygen-independent coproporphyrinogen-3 oxidase
MSLPLALYVHVPFCAVRCHYCDFNTYARLDALFEPYVHALIEEISLAGARGGRPPVRTIFIGGGTPTVLPHQLLEHVLQACRDSFAVAPDAEITSEANPGTADTELFAALVAMGVNRLSMGVQVFDDAELRWLGRMHTAAEAEAAYESARRAGFANINLDFMFGLPSQSEKTWLGTLARATSLAPDHISLYSLTVEHGTPLYDAVRRGLQEPPDDDLAADFYRAASEHLANARYEQYEISNWGRPGYQCRHNLVYWRHEPYLGFGPGAHSFDGERRWWNVKPVPQYIQRMGDGASPERDGEPIDRTLAMGEFMMLGLRLVHEGVTFARFRERFGVALDHVFGEEVAGLVDRGLLARLPDRVCLTEAGCLLGNQVFAQFLPVRD